MINYLDKFRLHGKKAVITGGSGLLGKQIVIALAQAGAEVIVADIDKPANEKFNNELINNNINVEFMEFDITDIENIENNIGTLFDAQGGIDIWVNNAYPRTKDWGVSLENITTVSWRKNIDMHLNSYALCTKYIAEKMKKKGGSIVNLGSIYGVLGPDFTIYEETSIINPMGYAAIKGGIINVSRYLASFFGKYNIRINTVCPGGVFDHQDPIFVKKYSHKTPLKRMANPEEIASSVLFLVSDAASYITGSTFMVDGGWSAI